MYKFLSLEWINTYMDLWNSKDKLVKDLKTFSASVRYSVENLEPGVVLFVENGVAKNACIANGNNFDFEMWAPVEIWRNIIQGNLGPKAALLTKKLKFKGSMITAMKYMGAFENSLKMMSEVPTNFEL
jgi:putative sterol carrier protein